MCGVLYGGVVTSLTRHSDEDEPEVVRGGGGGGDTGGEGSGLGVAYIASSTDYVGVPVDIPGDAMLVMSC